MDIFAQIGRIALGSRLRRLSEHMTDNAAQVWKMYGIELKPKWFPVYYVLANGEEKTITLIAEEIGHSHPLVSRIVHEMAKAGLVVEKKDVNDGRRNMVSLSKKGKAINHKTAAVYADVNTTIDQVLAQTNHDLWKALEEFELVLQEKPYVQRVKENRKRRESENIKIADYQPKYAKAFRELNKDWISRYFKMEESDYKALDNPEEYILNRGGYIYIALDNNEPVGVCALIKMNDSDYDFELAKMAVSPKAQGKNVGFLLGQAVIEKAKSLNAAKMYLETNTILKPAVNLYYKLGFKKIAGHRESPYERANLQMELFLKD